MRAIVPAGTAPDGLGDLFVPVAGGSVGLLEGGDGGGGAGHGADEGEGP